ncbi:hypothetical protein L596_025685 [Steinernema carpocapsae]|uniref:Uncharacterized protein n=1 Tax=Steinernema carpocapsae TaxID=34508 RepID=A0A4U5M8H0_STECR|nr:hypothetical protein L596_025685 [Steinernema carpocapsae]
MKLKSRSILNPDMFKIVHKLFLVTITTFTEYCLKSEIPRERLIQSGPKLFTRLTAFISVRKKKIPCDGKLLLIGKVD